MLYTAVDLAIFACLDFRKFVVMGLFTKSRIRELSFSMLGSAHNINFREILKFVQLATYAKIKTSRISPDL